MAFDPDKYIAETAPKEQKGFDPDQYLKETAPQEIEKSSLQQIGDVLSKGAMVRHAGAIGAPMAFAMNPVVQDGAKRAWNWLAGGARTLAAAPFGGVTKENAVQALKGEAPGLSTYLEQAGVPKGPNIPMTDISARSAAGFAGDIALDPLLYLNPAARLEGSTGKIAQAATAAEVNQATSGLGKYLYKSGLKKVDEEVAKYGKEPVSDVLMKERVTGSAKSIANQMDQLAADRLAKRDAILSKATKSGAITDVDKSLINADQFITDLQAKNDPRLNPLIEKMQEESNLLKTAQNVTPEQMSAMKSNSYSVVGDNGYNESKATPFWKRFEKAVGRGQKEEVERAVGESLGPAEREALVQHNDELGRLLSSQEKAEQVARIANNKNAFTSVDAMIAGAHTNSEGGLLHAITNPMLILKKALDISKETRFRTGGGLLLDDLSQKSIPAAIYRREISKDNSWKEVK